LIQATIRQMKLITSILFFTFSVNCWSASSKSTNKENKIQSQTSIKKNKTELASDYFSAYFEISKTNNLYANDFPVNSITYTLTPAYSFGNYSLASTLSYSQNLNDTSQTYTNGLDDTMSSITYAPPASDNSIPNKLLGISFTFSTLLPTSKYSQIENQFLGAFGLGTGISLMNVGDGLNSLFAINVGKNYYQFTTDSTHNNLNAYFSNQTYSLGYALGNFNLNLTYVNKSRWSYEGVLKNYFSISQQINYSGIKNVVLAIGHSNKNATFNTIDFSSNVKLVDEENSMLYTNLGFVF
jgi:hypothetical protein